VPGELIGEVREIVASRQWYTQPFLPKPGLPMSGWPSTRRRRGRPGQGHCGRLSHR
jgi:hypothetical protein